MNPARALIDLWRWLNTPNELHWGDQPSWRLHADKPTLAKAQARALRRD